MLKKEHIIHAVLWIIPSIYILYLSDNFIIGIFNKKENTLLIPFIYGTVINIFLFYLSCNLFNISFRKQQSYSKWILFSLILLLTFTFAESLIDSFYAKYSNPLKEYSLMNNIFIGNLVIHIVFWGLAIAYSFTFKAIKNEKQKQLLTQEKLSTELSYLKSQINPHFLFNTLNNLFSLARKNNDLETANGISQLSKMMRYMLYEGDVEKIPLSKEIDYIENYIQLQKLRFHKEDDITINVDVKGNADNFMITPLILVSFIENAFKHGIRIQNPSKIEIQFNIEKETLCFNIKNTKHKHQLNKEYSGFGLANVKNRLNLLYSNNHILNIIETESIYEVDLKLNNK